jgi:hypothetical protein
MLTRIALVMVLALAAAPARAQVYMLQNAQVSFFSDAPLEDITAVCQGVVGALDLSGRSFLFRVPIKQFQFPNSLMQEHFNENYLESEKYPNGTFKGKIEGAFDLKKDGEYPVTAVGELNIHGVAQNRSLPATLVVKNGQPSLQAKFTIKLADHKIDIPKVVFQKIAEQVEVTITSELKLNTPK